MSGRIVWALAGVNMILTMLMNAIAEPSERLISVPTWAWVTFWLAGVAIWGWLTVRAVRGRFD